MKRCRLHAYAFIAALAAFASASVQAGFDEGEIAFAKRDYHTAIAEWRPLAEAGDAEAQYKLGMMYRRGLGVAPDFRESAKWLLMAARHGHGLAQARLARALQNGSGIDPDPVEAYKWILLAVRNENPALEPVMLEMKATMTPGQVAEAEARAGRWRPED